MPNTDYAPRALSPQEARTWNARHELPTSGTDGRDRRVNADDLASLGLAGDIRQEAHDRVLAMMDTYGMSAAKATTIVAEAMMRRMNARPRKVELDTTAPRHERGFGRAYSKGGAWTPSHRVQAVEHPEVHARITQGKL